MLPTGALVIASTASLLLTPDRGFLPAEDPSRALPPAFSAWDQIGAELPKLLAAGRVRAALERLPRADVAALPTPPDLERAMLLLSFFGHAYVWGESPPARSIPASLAVPWAEAARRLGRPPVLSYASYALHNWRRLDAAGPIRLGNLALLQNFLGGVDEEWFILVHVEIEARAAPALAGIVEAQQAAADDDASGLERALGRIAAALDAVNATMARMPEHCDPYVYYNRVRPYIHGWNHHPALPDGLLYEGVAAFGGAPQKFRGETGAQSTIVPSLDAALGIGHKPDILREYLEEMRRYVPPAHRAFVESIERGPSVRARIVRGGEPALRDAYNACIVGLERFRAKHFEYAARYIHQQSQHDPANPTQVGTGGTPFMPYLGKHLSETGEHLIR
jgi:indoleamine 2,3-dioxygenase